MTTQGPNSPATAVSDNSVGTVIWNAPGNVAVSDNVRSTSSLGVGAQSHYLKVTNFGFAIPAGATINGIVVEVEKSQSGSVLTDTAVRIVKGGVIGSSERANPTAWPGTDAYVTYGGEADLWGETWTAVDINAADFGLALSCTNNGSSTRTARVDHVRMTIHYTEAGTANKIPVHLFFNKGA